MKEQDLPHGNKIIGFSSYEEMATYMAQQEALLAEAYEHLAPAQRSITYGSYALRLVPEKDDYLAIFGYIFTEEEMVAGEVEAGAGSDELVAIMSRFRELHELGHMYGRWHSVVDPRGEIGDAHLSTLWPITEADYQHALNNHWGLPTYLVNRVLAEMTQAEQ